MEENAMNSSQSLNSEYKTGTRWASEAIKFLGKGEVHKALHYLNLCLDDKFRKKILEETTAGNQVEGTELDCGIEKEALSHEDIGISPADQVSLLEKRCLIRMKLQHFDEVLNDARRILDKRTNHSLAYKCLLVALCKTNRLEQVNEILKLWRSYSPKDLDMMQCRTKLEALMLAVKNGIEPADAFSKVEDQLGLSYDWLLSRKPQDPHWKHRPLPPGQNSFDLCLPFRFGHCSLNEKCPDAHGEMELEEWKSRSAIKSITLLLDSIKLDTGEMYIRKVLEKIKEAGDERLVLTEGPVEGVKIKCSKPLEATVQSKKINSYKWTFAVESKKPLSHICLLHEIHRQYFHITTAYMHGANSKIDLMSGSKTDTLKQVLEITSPTAVALSGKKSSGYTYKLEVVFKPDVYGNFRQTVVFDTGEPLKTVRNISVDVVPSPEKECEDNDESTKDSGSASPTFENASSYRAGVTWNFGNADMVDCFNGEKVASHKLGFALINGANKSDFSMSILAEPLTKDNYKDKMRFFLTQEERARQEILAKYNVQAPLSLMENYVMTSGFNEGLTKYSLDGSLYGRMTLFRDVSEDTAVGRLILRSCNYLLMTKTEEARKVMGNAKPRVYLCPISDKTKNAVYIDVGPTCVSELGLKDGEVSSFDIQFQLDRTAFMEMKAVVDRLEDFHLDMLFPNFELDYHIPWNPIKQWSVESEANARLNPKQKESLIAITTETNKIPPILVIGPFGTGKTFSLAQCIRKLLTQPNIRIMVCTHSNSAADLYIKEYLDPWVEEGFTAAKPLRIYYALRNLNSVHPDVLQYCLIEKLRFRPPTLEEILAHRVIVVTLSTSYMLMQMNLPKDTFSHILLDEAAQAMESEAITPLMSAGESTKLVLAGDHMQLSPELFSEEAKSLHPSFLERLHNSYPDNHPCKLMLCENYRSHSAIIQYVSDAFYTKKLECGMVQPTHDNFYPMTFFAARGEEVQEPDSTSYYNMAEVFEVAERVSKLVASWPSKWGNYRNESAIGVLTPYSDQVSRIRSALRKKGLYSVSVERVLNVQGKQFRAVFLSTVRSFRPWVRILPEAIGNEVDLGFFSNPKLLNTALTRAQSLVAVVGDPVSLCSEGKCRNLWKDFLTICHKNKSLHGISYSQLEQSILGVEMRMTWGLNPLANEFEPKHLPNRKGFTKSPSTKNPHSVAHSSSTSSPSLKTTVPCVIPVVSSQQPPLSNIRHQQAVPQRNIAPGPPFHSPSGFQNPGMWPPSTRVPIVPQHQPTNVTPYSSGYYGPSGPRPNPNQIVYPVHGFPGPRSLLSVGIPPPPQPPMGPLPVPSVPYLNPSVAPRQYHAPPSGGYSSNVIPHPHSSISGQFSQSAFPPLSQVQLTKPSVQQLPNTGQTGLPMSGNVYANVNGHRSPLPLSSNTSIVSSGNFIQQPPMSSNHEQYATGLPLYRRTPVQSNPIPNPNPTQHMQQQQQSHLQTQNMNGNVFGGSNQSWLTDPLLKLSGSNQQPNFSREEMQLLNEMLENYSSVSSSSIPNETQTLQSKLREAVNIARGLTDGMSFTNEPISSSQGNWIDNSYNSNNISLNNQQAVNYSIAGSVNDIWSSFGLSDDQIRSVSNTKDEYFPANNNTTGTGSSTFGGLNPLNRQSNSPLGYNMTNHRHEQFMNTHIRHLPVDESDLNPWDGGDNNLFPDRQSQQHLGPGFGGLTGGPGENLLSNLLTSNQFMDSKDVPDSSGTGRSYANVVKHATTTAAVGGTTLSAPSSMIPSLNSTREFQHNPYSAYFQPNSSRQPHPPPLLPPAQSLLPDPKLKKNKKK